MQKIIFNYTNCTVTPQALCTIYLDNKSGDSYCCWLITNKLCRYTQIDDDRCCCTIHFVHVPLLKSFLIFGLSHDPYAALHPKDRLYGCHLTMSVLYVFHFDI